MKRLQNLNFSLILFIGLFVNWVCLAQVKDHDIIDFNLWKFGSQRAELAPINHIDLSFLFKVSPTFYLAGGGNDLANGWWYSHMNVEPLAYYQFQVYYKAKNVEEENRCILARILWFDNAGNQINRAEYPFTSKNKIEGWNEIKQAYQVPKGVTNAKIELVYRWDADGEVHFGGFSLHKNDDPGKRLVRLATVNHRPQNSSGTDENLEQFGALVEQAAKQHADIVCLPEGMTMVGTDLDYVSASESVPGPSTDFLGQIARKNNMYIVAGIMEKKGEAVFNAAVLIDRNGDVAGLYHKASLPREEIDGGVTPGDSLPVFETDFGKIGIMICWDVTFPEVARTLTAKGAEIIFLPIWGGYLTLAKARALENQVYLVSSSYDMESAIFDQEGEIIKEATDDNPVTVVEVDLNDRKYWPWLGDFKNRIPREMPSKKALRLE